MVKSKWSRSIEEYYVVRKVSIEKECVKEKLSEWNEGPTILRGGLDLAPASPHLRIARGSEWKKSGRVVRNRRRWEYVKNKEKTTECEE